MVQKSLTQPKARMSSEDRRSQLLRTAIETFARNGFGGTKTKDIAAAAGISEAILFRHFASKEDLYHAILDAKEDDDGAARAIRELQEFADRRDDLGLFRQFGFQVIRSFRDDPAFQRLLLYARLEGHLLADLFFRRFAYPTGDFLRDYVELRQKEGAFRQSDPKVIVMFAI
jgi:TetR/AcrR family transcriptional regulator